MESLEKQLEEACLEIAEEEGKCYGECEVCSSKTVLVAGLGLCGPCCFGEAETINGNW